MNSSQMRLPNTASMPIPPEGETKSLELNVELWHACAGPLVSLPAVGSRVLYLPQGHIEQVAASTQKEIDAQIPAYPNLPSQLLCQLHDVILHADMETDEVYCQMTLQPITGQEKDASFVPEIGSQSRQPNVFFCKTLTASDTSTHGGFSIPRRAAEKVFPPLNFSQQPPAQELIARDLHETEWKFRHIYRGQPKRHLLTTGWSIFVSAKRLTAGDSVLFIRNEKDELLIGIRRATKPQSLLSSSVLSSESMHIGVLAAAAHAANTNSRFTVFYKPRASPSEFVIPYAKFEKAVYHMRVSVGMRFRMQFETDESSVRRHLGTITGISDLDPVRWPKSQWRSIKVGWDETTISEQHQRVSLWEIEPLTTFLVYPPAPDWKLKHSWPQPMGATFSNDLEIDSLKKRALWMQFPNGSNGCNGTIPQGMGVNGPPLWSVYGASQENLPSKQETSQQQNPLLQADQMMMYMSQAQQQSQFLVLPHQLPQQTLLLQPQPMSHQQLPHQPYQQHPQLQQLPDHQQKQLPHQQQQELPHQQLPPQQLQLQQPQLQQKPTSSPTFQHHQMHPDKQSSPMQKQILSNFYTPALQQTFQSIFSGFVSDTSPSLHGYDSGTVSVHGLDVPLHDSNAYLHDSTSTITTPTISNHCSSGQQTQVINDTRTRPFSNPDPLLSRAVPPNSLYCYKDFPQEQDDMNMKCRKQSSLGGNVPLQQPMMTPSSLPSPPLISRTNEFQNGMIPNQSSVLSIEQPFDSNMYSSAALNDPHVIEALTSANAPVRTYTKVYKTGCVGRSLDISRFENYEELRSELGKLFGLEGQLEDTKSGWQLIFVDKEDDWLLLGDDPWEVFVNNVRWIKILSPSEAFQMQDGVGLQQASNSSEDGKTHHDSRHPSSVVTSTCPLGY